VVGRVAAVLILLAALVAWYEEAHQLHRLLLWQDVVLVGAVLMPAVFALALLALPLRDNRWLPVGALVLLGLAIGLGAAHFNVAANFAKYGALVAFGWLFLRLFEGLYLAVAVAVIIPWVDAYSVWRGPTRSITDHHPAVFTKLSIAFVVPQNTPARLGLPDVLFFALFLGASARFGLRPFWTWFGMCAALGLTIAATTYWANGGLPALPAISVGFLLPNIDLIVRRLRVELESRSSQRTRVALDRPPDD
jgi:hypothetical protein